MKSILDSKVMEEMACEHQLVFDWKNAVIKIGSTDRRSSMFWRTNRNDDVKILLIAWVAENM